MYKLAGAPTLSDERIGRHYVFSEKDTDLAGLLVYEVVGYRITLPVEVIDDAAPVEVVFTAPKDPKTPDELLKWVHCRLGEVEVMDSKILGVRGREQEGTPHQLRIREYQAARDEIQDAIARFYNHKED